MGVRLAREVSDHWGHLPGGTFKVLMRMALYSIDSSTDPSRPAELYWRGWQDLSEALGRKLPDPEDRSEEAIRKRVNLKAEVKRHTGVLVKLGAVERAVDKPGAGTRQVWKLTLGNVHDSSPLM